MHRYEEGIIMRDVAEMTRGGNYQVTAARLRVFSPGRYSLKLKQALERMARKGLIKRTGRTYRGEIYSFVPDSWERAA
jgi:hypothetical protein